MMTNQLNIINYKKYLDYPLKIWIVSRLIILLGMLVIAPLLPAPTDGIKPEISWEVFSSWDSGWYQSIATNGYEYLNDGEQHSVAFFPLFPLLIKLLINIGIPFEIGGTLINNLSFLLTLIILFYWIEKDYDCRSAKWVIASLAFFPISLYGTVIYTEGLFLFLTTTSLYFFERKKYFLTFICGCLATATRITGLALVPTFLIISWKEKRNIKSYFASLTIILGLLLYIVYCWLKFSEPLAFILVQKAWQPDQAFWGAGWLKMLGQITLGHANLKGEGIKDIYYLMAIFIIALIAYFLWLFRQKLGSIKTGYGYSILIFLMWLLGGNSFINLTTVLGGGYLLWHFKNKIMLSPLFYGLFSFIIIFSSGRTASAERYVYGIISVAMALGFLLKKYPRWGYITLSFFSLLLLLYSIRFAQHLWVA